MDNREPRTYLFYATVALPRGDDRRESRAEAVRLTHEGAWSLLASSLHILDPERFPGCVAEGFPGRAAERLPAVEKGPFGKPSFRDPSLPHFSLSHSGPLVVCAISERGPVGVDVQEMTEWNGYPGMDDMVRKIFHPREQEYYFSCEDPGVRRRIFYRIFSCKEAYVKMTGLGLSRDFAEFYVRFDEEGRPAGVFDGGAEQAAGYPLPAELPAEEIAGQYSLALCAERPSSGVEIRRITG